MAPAGSKPSAPRAARKRCQADGCRRLAPAGGQHRFCDEHRRRRAPAQTVRAPRLLGCQRPRLWTPPLRKLTRATTRGYELTEFAEITGEPFMPWQRWLAIHALELNPDGTYRFRVIIVLVARQNGKSSWKRTVSLWRLYVDDARTVLGVAQDLALAREQWSKCQETIHGCPDLEA
ncbi:MAG: hypothetical protein L0Y54_08375, partial [Sporichthyaceae bacterium]|nr:hypothetical protein [Sporichthyaceae bacterium]